MNFDDNEYAQCYVNIIRVADDCTCVINWKMAVEQ